MRWTSAGLFALGIAIWTWKLIEPKPVSDDFVLQLRNFSDLLPFLLAKTLHFTGYAGLTGLLVIALAKHWRIGVACMILHGASTEIIQTYVPNRTGKVTDVFLDSSGILLGAALTRWLLRNARSTSTTPQPESAEY